jgi:ABC-type arginine/histidine transport system permease subunit
LVFEKNANFSPKIVIITSTPAFFVVIYVYLGIQYYHKVTSRDQMWLFVLHVYVCMHLHVPNGTAFGEFYSES